MTFSSSRILVVNGKRMKNKKVTNGPHYCIKVWSLLKWKHKGDYWTRHCINMSEGEDKATTILAFLRHKLLSFFSLVSHLFVTDTVHILKSEADFGSWRTWTLDLNAPNFELHVCPYSLSRFSELSSPKNYSDYGRNWVQGRFWAEIYVCQLSL